MNHSARVSEEPDDDDIYLRPLFLCRVQAGPPSPADDSVEERLNLNRFIFRNPSSTILHRMEDDSLEAFGIFRGDILVIDRSLRPVDRKLVLAEINGDRVIRLVVKVQENLFLSASGEVDMCEGLRKGIETVLGVVTYSIHTLDE
jgi:DNA polymerase V